MLKKWFALLLSTLFMLAACNSPVYKQTEGNVADVKLKMSSEIQRQDANARTAPALVLKDGAYVDRRPKSLYHDPEWLNRRIVIRGDNLPFSYYSRTISSGASDGILTRYQTGLDPAVTVSMDYTGTVRGALNVLSAKTGYVYDVHNSSVDWNAFVTKSFDIAFVPGGTDYLMGKTSSSSGGTQGSGGGGSSGGGITQNYTSSDSSDAEFSNLKGTLSVWKDLESTIKAMLSKDGRVIVSESTTSVTVTDRPSNVSLVSQYVTNLNTRLSKQVLVKVQVLEVSLQNDYDYGINWGLVGKAFGQSKFILNANYGTPVSITSLTAQATGLTVPQGGIQMDTGATSGYTVLFNALNQQGKTAIVSEPRVVCLNNQVSVVRIVQQEGYVASIQNTSVATTATTSGTATVTSQVNPGTLITGLTLYILPKILNNEIYLQVNADLSTNNSFKEFGPVNSRIQLPDITTKHFNQRSKIHSGETLILSGFKQTSNIANANQLLTSQALGGKGSQERNKETIVLITPIILSGTA